MSSSQIAQRVTVLILFFALLLTGCLSLNGGMPSGAGPSPSPADGKTPRPSDTSDGGWVDWDGEGGWREGEKRAVSEAGEEVVLVTAK